MFKNEGARTEPGMVEQNVESAYDSSAEVESFTNDALALQRERLIRLIRNDGDISTEGGSNDEADNDSSLPSKFTEKIHHIDTDDVEVDILGDDKPHKVFDCFCNVITTRDFSKLVEKSKERNRPKTAKARRENDEFHRYAD